MLLDLKLILSWKSFRSIAFVKMVCSLGEGEAQLPFPALSSLLLYPPLFTQSFSSHFSLGHFSGFLKIPIHGCPTCSRIFLFNNLLPSFGGPNNKETLCTLMYLNLLHLDFYSFLFLLIHHTVFNRFQVRLGRAEEFDTNVLLQPGWQQTSQAMLLLHSQPSVCL